ncbi:MAG: hypothetical protein A2Z81_09720 [Omnitrophica WOR_2 bacterium GWA2_45_18]|nr:MAG: hypothetical protein A2Z81_09720 [Omnitrophica WOR_2 bacterium GWA2_45_18]
MMAHRQKLYRLFADRPMPDEQLLTCLGLYMRSSALAKILFVNELYELILNIPGVIMEFGTWWGQNLVLFENLRAIYEPFNQSRRVIGFDSFKGYVDIAGCDRQSETIKFGGYTVSEGYQNYLEQLVDFHEKNNILGNIKKHEVVEGDVCQTVPKFFKDNPETIVALAYFDLAVYKPTKICLEAIKPHLIRGSVVMFDELNSKDYPGETVAFKEVLKSEKFTLRKSRYMTDRTMAIMD